MKAVKIVMLDDGTLEETHAYDFQGHMLVRSRYGEEISALDWDRANERKAELLALGSLALVNYVLKLEDRLADIEERLCK